MTAAERRHLDRVAELGCVLRHKWGHECGGLNFRTMRWGDVTIHHVPPFRRRHDDEQWPKRHDGYVIGLCPNHHQGPHGIGVENGADSWEAKYGTQAFWLAWIEEQLRGQE